MANNCPKYKIDSNDTGLRFAVERCLKELSLPGQESGVVWRPLEPNSYGDFGGSITTVARNPINPSRQRQKGVVVDAEASASYTSDMTSVNHQLFMQGFLFSAAKELGGTALLNTPPVQVGAVTATELGLGASLNFAEGDIVLCTGYSVPKNNGVKVLGAITGTTAVVASGGVGAEPAPPAAASITRIGLAAAAGVVKLTVANGVNTVVLPAGHGLEPGDWFFLGGEDVATHFAANRGFARAVTVTGNSVTFDKQSWTTVTADPGTGKTIHVLIPTMIKNQEDPSKVERFSYEFERTLGRDKDGVMSQYVSGAVANEMTITVAQADKVTMEMGFLACDSLMRSGQTGVKPGSRPPLVFGDAFNTSSDIRRIQFKVIGDADPLFMYATDFSLSVSNNASGAKAIGVLGNFDINVGMMEIGGSVTAYFQDVRSVEAVRENKDVTMDMIAVSGNAGIVLDVPFLSLGNGMLGVDADQSITVPLDILAAQSSYGHTMMYALFSALPSWA